MSTGLLQELATHQPPGYGKVPEAPTSAKLAQGWATLRPALRNLGRVAHRAGLFDFL
jgi:hypothetical protein